MFRGNNEINIDAKGRMAIPVRYRDTLMELCGGDLVATVNLQDKCLSIYPLPKWKEIETDIAEMPALRAETRRIQLLLIGHARDLELDGNGRVLIPPELRVYAGLDKKVMLVGQSHRLELWDSSVWSAKCESLLDESQGEISEEVALSLSL